MRKILLALILCFICPPVFCQELPKPSGHVAAIKMNMMILPGTAAFLKKSIDKATTEGAKALVIYLNTPGGILQTTQEMIQDILASPVPIIVYVSPQGATAASAGVFVTLASHVAAMAPGTSIGAAHPVAGDGKDIEGQMAKKAENITIAMVKSLSQERGRNIEWAEKSVKESNSLTHEEALKQNVIDKVAVDLADLLRQIKGLEIKVQNKSIKLEDYSALPVINYEISFMDQALNIISNPTVAALLWLAATTGITIELYNPGLVLPGVVGVICLILALMVSQVLPVSSGAILLLIAGVVMIIAEMFVVSGALAIGGIIAIVLGAIYLVDVSQASGLSVAYEVIVSIAVFVSIFLIAMIKSIRTTFKSQVTTGKEAFMGKKGVAFEDFTYKGKIKVDGEIWNAKLLEGSVKKGDEVIIVSEPESLELEIKALSRN